MNDDPLRPRTALELERWITDTKARLYRQTVGKDEKIEQLKDLCVRAANVLEIINKGWPISELGLDPAIIAELRKAAQ
jgi:hypothetical protein